MKKISALLVVLLIPMAHGASTTWQWLDANGRKVFSDRAPPPEVAEKNIIKRPAGMSAPTEPSYGVPTLTPAPTEAKAESAAPKPNAGVDKDLEAKKKKLQEAETAKRKAEEEKFAKAKAENCLRAKEAKATYDSGVRISKTNASGEKEVLDDAARSAEVKRLLGIIETDCK